MNPFNRVWWRPRIADEVDEELSFHLEMRTRELIAAGMDPAAARREAERRLGDLGRMRTTLHALGAKRNQHMERTQYLGELRQDIAFTARQLVKNPGFTAVAVLTLALGIGATTAIFSAVYAVVLQPLPLRDPSRLMLVGEVWEGRPQVMSVGNYVDTNAAVADFEHGLSRAQLRQLQPRRRDRAGAGRRRARDRELLRRDGRPADPRPHVHRRRGSARQRPRRRAQPSAVDAPLRRQRIRPSAASCA